MRRLLFGFLIIALLGGVLAHSRRADANSAHSSPRLEPTTLSAAEAHVTRYDIAHRGAAYERVAAITQNKEALKAEFEKEIDADLGELIEKCKQDEYSIDELSAFVLKYGSDSTRKKWSSVEQDLKDSKQNIYTFTVSSNLVAMDHARAFRNKLPSAVRSKMKNAWLFPEKDNIDGANKETAIGNINIIIEVGSLQYDRIANDQASEVSNMNTVPTDVTINVEVTTKTGSSTWDGNRTFSAKCTAPEKIKDDGMNMNLFRAQQKANESLMADVLKQIEDAPEFIVKREVKPADGK